MSKIKQYWTLCKPRVVAMMILTLWVGMYLVGHDVVPLVLLFWTSLGVGMLASAGAALNHLIDREIDAKMLRTHNRPLPKGEITPADAKRFIAVLFVIGLGALWFFVNPLTAVLTLLTTLGYGVLYTYYLKRATSQNIVIGGLFGAMPPLLGWTAVTGAISPEPILLVLIIFVWTPPHFWALAIHRLDDYKKVAVPMLPVTHGVRHTKIHILLYTLLTFVASLLPFVSHMSGVLYLVGATLLGLRFIQLAVKLYVAEGKRMALSVFKYSNVYLMAIFILLLLDHYFWLGGV